MHTVLVTVFCADRSGLVAAITGKLFDLGANLGDASFAVLGGGAEFTAVCQIPDHIDDRNLVEELGTMPDLFDATISVKAFGHAASHAPNAVITHVVTVGGGDRPGLIARLAEVFASFKVNIVRMDAQTLPDRSQDRYVTRFALCIPEASAQACLATVDNTAGEMGLSCEWAEEQR